MKDQTTKQNFSFTFFSSLLKNEKEVIEIKMKAFNICIYYRYSFLQWIHIYKMSMTIYVKLHHLFCIYNLHKYVYAYKTK